MNKFRLMQAIIFFFATLISSPVLVLADIPSDDRFRPGQSIDVVIIFAISIAIALAAVLWLANKIRKNK